MNDLPDDILSNIYKIKHHLEMKNICVEILGKRIDKICEIYRLIDSLENSWIYLHEPESIIELYTALRNDGEIDNNELSNKIDNIIEDIRYLHYDPDLYVIDKDKYMSDTSFSINSVTLIAY